MVDEDAAGLTAVFFGAFCFFIGSTFPTKRVLFSGTSLPLILWARARLLQPAVGTRHKIYERDFLADCFFAGPFLAGAFAGLVFAPVFVRVLAGAFFGAVFLPEDAEAGLGFFGAA